MTDIEKLSFDGHEIRSVVVDGEPRFVLADICSALSIANPRNVSARIPDRRKGVHSVDTPGGQQNMTTVDEPGAYMIVMRSDKPGAVAFQEWLAEVATELRRTGRYEIAPQHRLPQTYADALRELAATVEERDEARAQLAIAAPKADYVDGFVTPDEDTSILRVFAGQLGTTDPKLRAYLKQRKVLSRRTVESRWSSSSGRMEPVYEWLALAAYRKWFVPKDQPEAPRLHNGQMRTTLYVTPVGKVGIRRLLMKHPIDGEAA